MSDQAIPPAVPIEPRHLEISLDLALWAALFTAAAHRVAETIAERKARCEAARAEAYGRDDGSYLLTLDKLAAVRHPHLEVAGPTRFSIAVPLGEYPDETEAAVQFDLSRERGVLVLQRGFPPNAPRLQTFVRRPRAATEAQAVAEAAVLAALRALAPLLDPIPG